jgi:hypothetical protein
VATSPLDAYIGVIYSLLRVNKTNEEIVVELAGLGVDTSEASIRRCIRRNESLQEAAEVRRVTNEVEEAADPAKFKTISDDEVEITLPPEDPDRPSTAKLTVEDVMRRHKLDPEDWEAFDVLPNEWEGQRAGGTKITFNQFKFRLRRRVPLRVLLPAIEPLSRTFKRPLATKEARPVVTVVETDPQNPFLLGELNELAITFIEYLQPDRHVLGGDLMNLGYIGRHRDNPKWDDTVQNALQTSFDYLYHRRSVAPDMEMYLIPGNHDDRIRNEQLERNERLYGVTQAHYPDEIQGNRVYSLAHLLRLDELGVTYHEPEGTYEFEYVELTPLLAVRHGHKLNASKTAPINTAMDLGHSVVLGHSHSQSAVAKTVWNKISGVWEVRWGVEAGCECEIAEGLGFNKAGAPDWQPGFVTVTSFPNGKFTFDFATYHQDGALYWRDQKFTL